MHLIRTAVIDETAETRKALAHIITKDTRTELAFTAGDREKALAAVGNTYIDVVLLSVDMPIIGEQSTLEAILSIVSVPVVILAKPTVESTAKTVRAISGGAIDFIRLPRNKAELTSEAFTESIIKKVVSASKANPERTRKKTRVNKTVLNKNITSLNEAAYEQTIVAIGASTGGPRALQTVLVDLPSDFNAPIVIVQHMPAGFTRSLAERLNGLAAITVKEAEDGEVIQPRTAYIAPGNFHMKVVREDGYKIKLTKEIERLGHRPSVNTLFDSLAQISQINIIAVVLTGMGKDGAEGIEQIKKKNKRAIIIAESKESAIVYGMPAAAVKTSLVNETLHLQEIGKVITKFKRELGGI
ncbi:chemotaxis-specific protein-glutamate methyltransferase CheB [Virgibacillus sp. W0430]|uniref:chemotaxis-specific protein-glutamate methyltransferase CheB n=1 Tax=Virgibacillus sp. W0430 TaxID=3391580 RepID=UPI003F4544FD